MVFLEPQKLQATYYLSDSGYNRSVDFIAGYNLEFGYYRTYGFLGSTIYLVTTKEIK